MTRTARNLGVFALALVAVLLGMSVRVSFDWLKLAGAVRPDPEIQSLRTALSSARDPLEIFTKVARVVSPSVVSVHGDVYYGNRRAGEQAGTGVIVDNEGHVLTNFHVVDDASELSVELSNGRRYRALIKGGSELADLAVLQIQDANVEALTPVVFGDSDAVEVGQSVLAIGNAFEFRGTVTHGIISSKARPLVAKAERVGNGQIPVMEDYIQTDAAINPGNSGGPLVNMRGEVIGINTLIYSRSGASAGIGFAIPSNYAKLAMRQIIETGNIVRGGIGVTASVDDATSTDDTEGVRVETVTPNSPADEAGVQPGDTIVELDGRPIHNFVELKGVVSRLEEGRRTNVKIERRNRYVTLPITIGAIDKIRAPKK
jgi:S1-C subfamily serine protease